MNIAVHGRTFSEQTTPFVQAMFDELHRLGAALQVSATFRDYLAPRGVTWQGDIYHQPAELFDADFIISVGGDGTLLDTLTHVGARQTPILAVNAGRLGFLATISPETVTTAIQCMVAGKFRLDERTLVHVSSDQDVFEGINFGLNDFTITKRDTSSMIVVHTYIDGEYLNSYWADGLIVATPTGSTGYSLSCGGPVVLPHSANFIIAPISPHNLNVRPLIVSDDSVISFEIEGRGKNYLVSLDSRSRVVEQTIQLSVRKEQFKARLFKMPEDNFLNTLRNKLNWGMDARN